MSSERADWTPYGGMPAPSSSKLAVMFQVRPVKNNFKSEQAGRDIFEEKIFIIKIPSDAQYNRPERPMRESDKFEYPEEWAAFERTGQSRIIGIPIEHWPQLSMTQKAEFKAMHIHTVEQFAALPDSVVQKIMGGMELRLKAIAYVETGKDAEFIVKLKAEAKAENDALRSELAELRAMIEGQTAPKK